MSVKKNAALGSAPAPALTEVLAAMPAYDPPAAAVDIKLDQRSMVAIVVQRAGESWERDQAEATAQAARIQREIQDLESRLDALVRSIETREFRDRGEAAIAALAGLGIHAGLKFTVGSLDRQAFTIPVEGKIEVKKGGYGSFDFAEELPATPAMRELVARLDELAAEKSAHVEVATAARRNLADVPRLERWAEAQIAELVLGRSAGGQDWLDSLDAKLRQRVDLSGLKRQLRLIG